MPLNDKKIKELTDFAFEARKNCLYCIANLGVGHIGGALSVTDILTYLYNGEMKISPGKPSEPDRDMLVLSKGHSGPALYAVLAMKGYFPLAWLKTLNQGGTNLPSHADRNRTPGVDMSTGSLGQGLSAASGAAYGEKLNGGKNHVYCIIGDGESVEGQIWEAAFFAAHYKLDNLIAVTDYNKLQIDGFVSEVMGIEDIEAKWKAFGWQVIRADGHDFASLDRAFSQAHEKNSKPKMIIADTVKAKGFPRFENTVACHNANITLDEIKELYKGEVPSWLK